MGFNENMLTSDVPVFYPKQGNVDFVAYYPYTDAVGVDFTIAVNIANQAGGLPEMLYSNNAVNRGSSGDIVPLVFRYSLAKLRVSVKSPYLKATDFEAITASLEGMNTEAKWRLADGTFTEHDGRQQPITLCKTGATATEATFEALILPFSVSAGDAEFVILAGNDVCRFSAEGDYVAGKQYYFNFTLHVKAPAVTGVKFENPSPVISPNNQNFLLTPVIEPFDAFNPNVTWKSSDPTVAEIDKNGRVAPKTEGTTTITVTTEDGGFEATCLLTVIDSKTRYCNPVIRQSVPDPHVFYDKDGYFYLFGTGGNIPIFRSADLVNWTQMGTAFTNATRPPDYLLPYGGGGDLWAPELNYINGKYVLYYSMSRMSGPPVPDGIIGIAVIGAATADKPEGPYINHGLVIASHDIGVKNSIDQTYIEDDGKKYMFWGSFNGIWGVELSDDGLGLKDGSMEAAALTKRQIAGTAYEGSYIHKRGGYYYLFASIGSCCNGLNSTYQTVVGRSQNLFGPYTDKQGRQMMQNNHEVLISRNHAFVGTGHNSPLVQDNAGNNWIIYHGYCMDNNNGRNVFLDKVAWVNDWPSIGDGSPSTEADIPVF
jgi:arabinan endo-1,5-alpha-L-arabinosidase